MADNLLKGDTYVNGNLQAKTWGIGVDTITNAMIREDASVTAGKFHGKFRHVYQQPPGTAIVDATIELGAIAGAAATLRRLRAALTGALVTGTDRTVTIDLLKGNAAGAYATVLTAPIVLNNASVLRTLASAAIATTAAAGGDLFRLTVAVAGSDAAQGQGLVVDLDYDETPN